jgi:hypothetical protein
MALARDHDKNRSQHDERIERETHILDIEEIVLQLLPYIRKRRIVRVLDLSPPCDASADPVTTVIKREFLH